VRAARLRVLTIAALAVGIGLGAWGTLEAQTGPESLPSEVLDFDRPESWAMARLVALTLFTGMGSAGVERPTSGWRFVAGGELGWVPALPLEERMVGFFGTKEEDMNKSPVFGRVRLGVVSAGGWLAEVGVTPPLEVGGARPLLAAGAFGWAGPVGEGFEGSVRLHGQVGEVRGDITCAARVVAAGDDPERNPFECEEPSRDRVLPRYLGLEVSAGRGVGAWEPFVGVSVQHLSPRFKVSALHSSITDQRTLSTSGTAWSASAGVGRLVFGCLPVAIEGVYSPLWVQRRFAPETERGGVWNVRGGIRLDRGRVCGGGG